MFAYFIFCLMMFTQGLFAQFSISAEVRPRAEYRHGLKTLANRDQPAAFFIDQRSRINTGFKAKDTEIFLTLQNVSICGNQPQLVIENGRSPGLHQAWAKIKFDGQWALKLGRQEINYDDQRIFGSVDWAQQARSHDCDVVHLSG